MDRIITRTKQTVALEVGINPDGAMVSTISLMIMKFAVLIKCVLQNKVSNLKLEKLVVTHAALPLIVISISQKKVQCK